MSYYPDLRSFMDVLDEQGKLHRFKDPIDKDRELLPLVRIQQRGVAPADRKVFLFEDVRNAAGERYDISVAAGVYGFSDEIVMLGLNTQSYRETLELFHRAIEHPIPPRIVEGGPVQEVVLTGDDITERGLDIIPAPVEEPGFSQIIRAGLPIISKDPETGVRNAGAYNAFFRDRDRLVSGAGQTRDIMHHWQTARRRGEDLPVAIVVGCTPNLMFASSIHVAYGDDEVAIAGGLAGEPMELVPCKTVPLEVPANAEIVIEGLMSTRVLEPRLAFGEYPGYMHTERTNLPTLKVTAITHRKDAMFTPVLVGFPPVESTTMSLVCSQALLYQHLRYKCGLPVSDVGVSTMGGNSLTVIQAESGRVNAWQILQAAASFWNSGKWFVLVDHDINPRDPDMLMWTLSWRVQPERDITIERGRYPGLDPSNFPLGAARGMAIQSAPGSPRDYFRVLIDATMKGVFPPVALPKREYMERALEIWKKQPDLPEPQLREPWYGYTLGYWTEEDQRLADLIAGGDYKAVGRITAEMQSRTDDALP